MARTIPEVEPTSFVVGDTLKWYRTFSDFPASEGWALTYAFRGPGELNLSTEVTNDGSRFVIVVPAATSALASAGVYEWTAYVTLAGERYTAATGRTVVAEDLSVIAGPVESESVKQLRIVEAAIEGRLTADTESFSINGRAVNKTPIEMLYKIRNKLRWEVYAERNGSMSMPVRVGFNGV